MSTIFISHVETDADVAVECARALAGAGYDTWYYEQDSLPGTSYLVQVGTVRLWRRADGGLVRRLEGHSREVGTLAVAPDGQHIISGSGDSTIKIWRLSDGGLVRTMGVTKRAYPVWPSRRTGGSSFRSVATALSEHGDSTTVRW